MSAGRGDGFEERFATTRFRAAEGVVGFLRGEGFAFGVVAGGVEAGCALYYGGEVGVWGRSRGD